MDETRRKYLDLPSPDVLELISKVPAWGTRWGTLVICFVLIFIFAGTWFLRYPDVIVAPLKLVSVNEPKAILAKGDGRITRLFKKDGDAVESGEILCFLENTANPDNVLQLSSKIEISRRLLHQNELAELFGWEITDVGELGELQGGFEAFAKSFNLLKSYQSNNFYATKRNLLLMELEDLRNLDRNLAALAKLQEQDIKLAEQDYGIQLKLAEEEVISDLDLRIEESQRISRHIPYHQTKSIISQNLIAIKVKQTEILEFEKQYLEALDNFHQVLNSLQSAIEKWKLEYTLTSPIDGKLNLPVFVQENQIIRENEPLFYILNDDSTQFFGELRVPQLNFGKVKVDQTVLVKFPGYPYGEFGSVIGRIKSLSDVPLEDGTFVASVEFLSGLKTTYNHTLIYKHGLSASGEIVTEESRLFHKIFYQFRQLIN